MPLPEDEVLLVAFERGELERAFQARIVGEATVAFTTAFNLPPETAEQFRDTVMGTMANVEGSDSQRKLTEAFQTIVELGAGVEFPHLPTQEALGMIRRARDLLLRPAADTEFSSQRANLVKEVHGRRLNFVDEILDTSTPETASPAVLEEVCRSLVDYFDLHRRDKISIEKRQMQLRRTRAILALSLAPQSLDDLAEQEGVPKRGFNDSFKTLSRWLTSNLRKDIRASLLERLAQSLQEDETVDNPATDGPAGDVAETAVSGGSESTAGDDGISSESSGSVDPDESGQRDAQAAPDSGVAGALATIPPSTTDQTSSTASSNTDPVHSPGFVGYGPVAPEQPEVTSDADNEPENPGDPAVPDLLEPGADRSGTAGETFDVGREAEIVFDLSDETLQGVLEMDDRNVPQVLERVANLLALGEKRQHILPELVQDLDGVCQRSRRQTQKVIRRLRAMHITMINADPLDPLESDFFANVLPDDLANRDTAATWKTDYLTNHLSALERRRVHDISLLMMTIIVKLARTYVTLHVQGPGDRASPQEP